MPARSALATDGRSSSTLSIPPRRAHCVAVPDLDGGCWRGRSRFVPNSICPCSRPTASLSGLPSEVQISEPIARDRSTVVWRTVAPKRAGPSRWRVLADIGQAALERGAGISGHATAPVSRQLPTHNGHSHRTTAPTNRLTNLAPRRGAKLLSYAPNRVLRTPSG